MTLGRMTGRTFVVSVFAVVLVALGGDAQSLFEVLPAAAAPRHSPIAIRERLSNASVTSTNWSGYAVVSPPAGVTDVTGSWVIPAVQGACSAETQASSFWVGIDGFSSNTVEQIGTDSDCVNGAPTYYAWLEVFPLPALLIRAVPVAPGDVISAEVRFGGGMFTMAITNQTTGRSFHTSVRVPLAHRSSAEWIAEAPSSSSGVLPLTDFGTVFFGAGSTGVANTCDATVQGSAGPIGSFGAAVQQITMVDGNGAPKAVPSSLTADGSSFSVQWVSAGP